MSHRPLPRDRRLLQNKEVHGRRCSGGWWTGPLCGRCWWARRHVQQAGMTGRPWHCEPMHSCAKGTAVLPHILTAPYPTPYPTLPCHTCARLPCHTCARLPCHTCARLPCHTCARLPYHTAPGAPERLVAGGVNDQQARQLEVELAALAQLLRPRLHRACRQRLSAWVW